MYVFNIINVLIETVILLFYCKTLFEWKSNINNVLKIVVSIVLFGVSATTSTLHLPTHFNLAIALLICLAFLLILFKGKLRNKVFLSAIYIVIIFFADILATITITFFGIEYSMSGGDNVTYIVGAMLSDFIRLWLLAYVGKILSQRIQNLPISYWIFMLVCPVLSIMCLVIFDIYLMQAEEVNKLLIFIPPFCILYINFMLFRFFETFSEQIRLRVIEELAQKEEENYKILQNNETELRKLRHDMKNHIMMLQEYLENDDAETALQHLKSIQETLSGISSAVYTNNPAIDAAINIGARKAQAENIEYKAQIIGDAIVKIEAADICKFLSNAIDNAIEACILCEKKHIYIELNITTDNVKIHIENTTMSNPDTIKFLTSKTDRKNHGYGIKNMKSVVKKYNGMMETKVSNEVFYLDTILYNI